MIIVENTIINTKIEGNVINPPNIDIANIKYTLEKNSENPLTLLSVAKHNTKNNCYLVINNNVYDVSSYISYHPGGSRVIVSNCGKEVTGLFARIHSNRAWDLLAKYKIGTVQINTQDITSQILTAIFESLKKENPDAEIVNVRPKNNFYIAKIVYNTKLYEIHIDNTGNIIQEEVEGEEIDWSLWDTDSDDK